MKIYIDQIPEAGLELQKEYLPASLDLNREDIRFTEPIRVVARVTREADNLAIKLHIKATLHLNCSRCLEEFTTPFLQEVKLNLPIEQRKEVDLTANLREEIILSYPLKPLCRADCRGLCSFCGQNLNQGECGC